MAKPTISDAIKTLERKQLISKHYSELDKRKYSIALTKKGEAMASDC